MSASSGGPPRGPKQKPPNRGNNRKYPQRQTGVVDAPQQASVSEPNQRGARGADRVNPHLAHPSVTPVFIDQHSFLAPVGGVLDPSTGEFFPSTFPILSAAGSEPLAPAASGVDSPSQVAPPQARKRGKNRAGQPQTAPQAAAPAPQQPQRRDGPKSATNLESAIESGNRSDLRRVAQAEAAKARAKSQKRANISDFGNSQSIYDNVEAPVTSLDPEAVDELPAHDSLNGHVVHDHTNNTRSRKGGGGPKVSTEGQTELATKIINDLIRSKYDCVVCFAPIKRHVAVWSCNKCYSVFHIFCVKKWSQSSTSAPPQGKGFDKLQWSCPKCRAPQSGRPESHCFCGKTRDPAFDPFVIPHSCGEPCKRLRAVSPVADSSAGTIDPCPHPCALLCHPGPCPPCSALGATKRCFCGRTDYRLRCGLPDPGRSCSQPCRKQRSCTRHSCNAACHPGACTPCQEQLLQKCFCGKVEEFRTCGSEAVVDTSVSGLSDPRFFSCTQLCGRSLSCGNHKCEEVCHTGPCKPCSFDPAHVRSCPCGATPLKTPRRTCLDPIPTCDLVCNRFLSCGKHQCTRRCHHGPCEGCTASVTVPCRCGSSSTSMKCIQVYPDQLETVIAANRCERLCDELKECGRHRCSNRCCPTQRNKSDPEGLHICRITCGKRLGCGLHTCKQLCHRGKCQRCLEARFEDLVCPCGRTTQEAPIVCGTPPINCPFDCTRPRGCGHPIAKHACHSSGECPSCTVLVNKVCLGGHTTVKSVPCFKQDVSCGKVCGKQMRCGLHACSRLCHGGVCEATDAPSSQSCGHKCDLPRPSCEHTCQAACHPGETCPDVSCKLKSRIFCSCTRLSADIACTGGQLRTLACDEKCALEKRNRQLAEAFGILGTGKEAPRYSDTLLHMAKSLPSFIVKLEKQLDDFLKTPATLQKTQLPMMDRVQRQCVHELAKYYNLETESYDVPRIDSNMKIVEIAKRRDSAPPTIPLSAVAGVSDPSGGVTLSASATTSIMQFYDLTASIQTSHLVNALAPFSGEYVLFHLTHLRQEASDSMRCFSSR